MYQKKLYYWKWLLMLITLISVSACIQENNNLVNPPLITETVQIRFLNLAGDEAPRTLVLEKVTRFESVPYNTISNPQAPPFDSVSIQIFNYNILEFGTSNKQKFARHSNYIMVALPTPNSTTEKENVDSVFVIQTSILKPADTMQCYLKFLNANPDDNITYSLKLGCPNGNNVFVDNAISNFSYHQSSGIQALYEGKRVFSLVKNLSEGDGENSTNTKLIGIFELDLKHLGQYLLLVNKNDEVFFIDELSTTPVSLISLKEIDERSAYIRTINLSSETISITKTPGVELATNLNPYFIDNYTTISTCDATALDKISLIHNGNTTDSAYYSFDVYNKYSLLTFDRLDKKASQLVVVPPINDRFPKSNNKAIVRVVNGNYAASGITVSIGAKDADNQYGYESGNVLAVNLEEGEFSKEYSLNGGLVPISVFASTKPTKYLFSSNIHLDNGKEYLIAVDFSNGEGRIVAIEQNGETQPISFESQTAFLQIVNAVSGANQISFSLQNIISNGKIDAASSIATFIPEGTNSVTINGNTHTFNANKNLRSLVIASSNVSNVDVFDIQSEPMTATPTELQYRIINASDDVQSLQVNLDSVTIAKQNIQYQFASDVSSGYRDGKYSFYFINQNSGKELLRLGDLLMTLNKNYSIIFFGNEISGYKVTVVQEY